METDDIVTRLRAQTIGCDDYNCESCEIETEAADEIERLRTQIKELETEKNRLERLTYG